MADNQGASPVEALAAAWETEAASLELAAAECAPGDPSRGETAQATAYRNEAKIYRRNAAAVREQLGPAWERRADELEAERDGLARQLADLRTSLDYCAGQWESNAMPHTMPPRSGEYRAVMRDCARDLRHALKANAPDAADVRGERDRLAAENARLREHLRRQQQVDAAACRAEVDRITSHRDRLEHDWNAERDLRLGYEITLKAIATSDGTCGAKAREALEAPHGE